MGFGEESAEGPMRRFNIIINFLSAVLSCRIKAQALSNQQVQNLNGYIRVLAFQASVYKFFVTYLAATVSYLNGFEVFNVGGPMRPYNIDYDTERLLSITAKLSMFSADFKGMYHEMYLWSHAVKREIKFICRWFATLFSNDHNSTKYLTDSYVSNSALREFLKPIADEMKYMVTTDMGMWVWMNLWDRMVVGALSQFDEGDGANVRSFKYQLAIVEGLEDECGYRDSVLFNVRSSTLSPLPGIRYDIIGSLVPDNTVTRSDIIINPTLVIPSKVTHAAYKCFKFEPVLSDSNTSSDDYKVLESIREGFQLVRIPQYFRFNFASPVNYDMITIKQPLIMPERSLLSEVSVRPTGTNFTLFGNQVSDILFLSSDDLGKLFSLVRV